MRIAHIVRRYTSAEWGGTETVVRHTLEEQQKLGHDVKVFCTKALALPSEIANGYQGTDSAIPVAYFDYRYPYFPMPQKDRLMLDKKGGNPFSPALFKAVTAYKPDIIHIHAGGRLACTAIRLAESLQVPSLISLHGGAAVVPKREMELMLKPIKGKFPYGGIIDRLKGLRFDPVSRVSAVICISRAEEDRLKKAFPNQRVCYLPNGVNPVPGIEGYKKPQSFKNILCVSRIDYQKNQLALVELLANTQGTHLTLVGPITAEWYRDEILARVKELGVESRFTLIPGLPPDSRELQEQFNQADVFILPSLHEPFGIVALEAMAHHIPLITSNAGGLPDFVHDGKNGLLFDPAVSGALTQAFGRLTPELAEALVKTASEDVQDFYWPSVIRRLEALYAELKG